MFVIPLFFLNFFVFAEHMVVVPLSADISRATGLEDVKSGLLVSVYPLSAAVSAFLTAPFSDRLGRKKVLTFFCFGFCISTFCFAMSESVASIIVFRIMSGVFGGPIPSNILAYAGDSYTGKRRAKIITMIMLAFSSASILAVPFGAWLADSLTWKAPFFSISAGLIICLLAVLA